MGNMSLNVNGRRVGRRAELRINGDGKYNDGARVTLEILGLATGKLRVGAGNYNLSLNEGERFTDNEGNRELIARGRRFRAVRGEIIN